MPAFTIFFLHFYLQLLERARTYYCMFTVSSCYYIFLLKPFLVQQQRNIVESKPQKSFYYLLLILFPLNLLTDPVDPFSRECIVYYLPGFIFPNVWAKDAILPFEVNFKRTVIFKHHRWDDNQNWLLILWDGGQYAWFTGCTIDSSIPGNHKAPNIW